MNLFSFIHIFDGFKKRRLEKKLTRAIQIRRSQMGSPQTLDYAYLGDDFLFLPNIEENTALLSFVIDGKMTVQCLPLNEYMSMIQTVYDFRHPKITTKYLEDDDVKPRQISEEERKKIEERELQEKLEKLRALAEDLRQRGVSEELIHVVVSPEQKLNEMSISSDLQEIRIYGRDEKLDLRPLPKALYLLFLKHPEGIAFKDLVDYRDELLAIYNRLSPKKGDQNEKSIDDLVDPTNNSANEKCSRIRAAFVKLFDEATARHYYIDGKRGEKKKIDLDRKLVSWEE